MKTTLGVFAFSVTALLPARAADYYFSASGSDVTGDGSLGAPWATVAKANTLDLEPGDRVLFEGGATFDLMDASSPVGGELVANPGFELGTTSWNIWSAETATIIGSPVYSGSSALELVGAADSYPGFDQDVNVSGLGAGDVLVLRFRVRETDMGGVPNNTDMQAGIRIDYDGSKVRETWCNITPEQPDMLNGWVEIVGAIQMPEQFDRVNVWFYTSGGMTLVFDDFSLRQVANQGGSLVLGADDDGASGNRVVVASYGTGRATLDADFLSAIELQAEYVEIANLDLVGLKSSATDSQHGLHARGRDGTTLEDIYLHDCSFFGFGGSGVYFDDAYNTPHSGFDGILIEDCLSQANRRDGFEIRGTYENTNGPYAHRNIQIRRCRAIGNTNYPFKNSGNGIMVSDAQNVLIEHCYAEGNGADSQGKGPVGILAWDCDNLVIQWCEAAGNLNPAGVDGGGFDLDGGCTNSEIQYCYSHDNDGPGFFHAMFGGSAPTNNNVFRYNISINDAIKGGGQGVINYWGGVKDCHTHNCVVIGGAQSTALMRRESGQTGCEIFNNIFVTPNNGRQIWSSATTTDFTYRNNLFYSLDGNDPKFRLDSSDIYGVPAWQAAMPAGSAADNLQADPLFAGTAASLPTAVWLHGDTTQIKNLPAFRLTGASPAIDAGLDAAPLTGWTNLNNDLYGNPATANAAGDIGVHEFSVPFLYEDFQSEHFTASEIDEGKADPGYDYLGAGWENLLFFALGLDPKNYPHGPPLTLQVDGAELAVEYTALDAGDDVDILLESSTDLAQWDPAAPDEATFEDRGDTERATLRFNLDPDGLFLRLRFSER